MDRGKTVYPPPPSGSGRIIIQNVLERKDSMAVLPIGFGKSMCYVSPSHFGQGKIIFVAFFSATIDSRNLIFGHNLHIGTPYRGKHFWTRQIPTSCLPILLIFIHI
jgi:hypothetical protein